jgi:hypothetical protein
MALQQQRGGESTVEQVDSFVVLGIFLPLPQHLSPTLPILAAQMLCVDFLEGVGVLCLGLVVDRQLGLGRTGNISCVNSLAVACSCDGNVARARWVVIRMCAAYLKSERRGLHLRRRLVRAIVRDGSEKNICEAAGHARAVLSSKHRNKVFKFNSYNAPHYTLDYLQVKRPKPIDMLRCAYNKAKVRVGVFCWLFI